MSPSVGDEVKATMQVSPRGALTVVLELDYDGAEYVAGVLRNEWTVSRDRDALEIAEELERVVEQIDDRLEDRGRRV